MTFKPLAFLAGMITVAIVSILMGVPQPPRSEARIPAQEVWGLDISHHQGEVQWDKLGDLRPSFMFLKATEGSTFTDSRYYKNRRNCEKLGIPTGPYHFFSYHSSGVDQANHFLRTIGEWEHQMPLVLDVEFKRNMHSKIDVRTHVEAFMKVVKREAGKYPLIYAECAYIEKYVPGGTINWIANFHKEPPCEYLFWQQTDKYNHPAFRGTVDYNVYKGSHAEFKDRYHGNVE